MPDLTGHELGRYHLLEKLGEGGMAIVYKAYDTRLETDVAVKVIQTESLPQNAVERALKRFEREAKALARLTHPNIVKVTDYGEYEGKPYLVMPYLPGGTLKEKLGKPIPWQEAVELVLPVAEALAYAHSQRMIHRDVKPSNIILTQSGRPMLTDFGIAKLLDLQETVDLTGTSAAVGTPEYMAPEQAHAKTVDHRADIYALGIVLYEMVTGRKPFVADTPMAVLVKQITEPLPRPKQFAPSLSDRAEKILIKALAKKPDDRYQTMDELYAALVGQNAILSRTAEKPRPRKEQTATITEPPARELPRKEKKTGFKLDPRLWYILGGLVVVLFCGFALYYAINNWPATASPTPTPPQSLPIETVPPTRPSPTEIATTTVAPTVAPTPGIGSTWTSPKDGMVMMFVPAGRFTMGSDALFDEKPVHDVTLDSFWIDQTEVTNVMYAKCVQAGACDSLSSSRSYTRDNYYGNHEFNDYPVIYVSWHDAKAYCDWRGNGTRLPTEAEWEKAASWDANKQEKRVYPWGDFIDCSYANFSGCRGDTTKVGDYSLGASFYGLLDMAGNVSEWVVDWYDGYPGNTTSNSSFGTQYHVLRGGAWYSSDGYVRSAHRSSALPLYTYYLIGFRCSRSLP